MIMLHAKGISLDTDFDAAAIAGGRLAEDAKQNATSTASLIVLMEADNAPNASQRKRLASADRLFERLNFAFVTGSTSMLLSLRAIYWLSPERQGVIRSAHGTYERARAWQQARTGFPAEVFDALHEKARDQIALPADVPRAQMR
jgi:hypothetical protein